MAITEWAVKKKSRVFNYKSSIVFCALSCSLVDVEMLLIVAPLIGNSQETHKDLVVILLILKR